jgi:hypothetical protein
MSVNVPRWTLEDDGRTIKFTDGERFKFPSWVDQAIVNRVAMLAADYVDLGMQWADTASERDAERSKAKVYKYQLDALVEKVEGLGDEDRNRRLLVILQQDLEHSINLLLRFAYALGVQPGGELYNELQGLARKYGMDYRAPKEYSAAELIDPVSHGEGSALPAMFGERPRQIESGDDIEGNARELNA